MKKIINLILGITIIAIGTAICNYTGLGIDPFNALCTALSLHLSISLGTMTLCIQCFIALVIICINKKYLGIGSIVPMFIFGYLLQICNYCFSMMPSFKNPVFIFLTFLLGMLFITLGMTLYMNTKLGMVPYDGIAFAFSELFKKNAFHFRVILDVGVSVFAYLMHGPIAIGTILLAFGIGPLLKVIHSYII